MARPASIAWFARHELRLAWRDWLAMATGGKRTRGIVLAAALGFFALGLHWLANVLIEPWVTRGIAPGKPTLVFITGGGFLFWTVMLSQALESVTRAYYGRSDLDLLLSSPVSSRRLFAVRTGAIAFTTMALACLLASPLVDMLALNDGPQWLSAYGVMAAMSALATAIAVLITIGLFRLFGPKRTRLIAQIVAGIVGAGFVIGIQAVAIVAYGNMSRFSILQSAGLVAAAPDLANPLWLPARAAMGDLPALAVVLLIGLGSLGAVVVFASSSFGRHAIAAAGVSRSSSRRQRETSFRRASQKHALRLKEWKLLARDPWLLSQTLMQILYLLPPALLLWINYRDSAGIFVVVVPVLVMASGQLAGGLAWLAISGEDAHDLVVTAPVTPPAVLTAKIEAVLSVLGIILLPILLLIASSSVEVALITAICIALSAGSATAIQLWFRTPMRRSMFRRRQVASRMATVSEAFASIMWAGTAALLVAGSWIAIAAIVPAAVALGVLGLAWGLGPKGKAA
ncbi:MAG: permease [Devosia sp.]|nr:permease [Devosia sp.]